MEVERIHIGLVRKVGLGALAASAGAVLIAARFDLRFAVGVALGGGLILLLYGVYCVVMPVLLSARAPRRPRAIFWLIWALKWPIMGAALSRGSRPWRRGTWSRR